MHARLARLGLPRLARFAWLRPARSLGSLGSLGSHAHTDRFARSLGPPTARSLARSDRRSFRSAHSLTRSDRRLFARLLGPPSARAAGPARSLARLVLLARSDRRLFRLLARTADRLLARSLGPPIVSLCSLARSFGPQIVSLARLLGVRALSAHHPYARVEDTDRYFDTCRARPWHLAQGRRNVATATAAGHARRLFAVLAVLALVVAFLGVLMQDVSAPATIPVTVSRARQTACLHVCLRCPGGSAASIYPENVYNQRLGYSDLCLSD